MAKKKSKSKVSSKKSFLSGTRKVRYLCLIFFVLGGLLTNIDRLGTFGQKMRGASSLLPRSIRWVMPGYGVPYGSSASGTEIIGTIINVADGDTATLLSEDGNTKYRIRFYGIDAPESDQAWGKESKRLLVSLIDNKKVKVKVDTVDMYQRHVGKVYIDDVYVNLEMVKQGMAWHYYDYAKNDYDIAIAEKKARVENLGLWQQKNPQPPWEYRRANQ